MADVADDLQRRCSEPASVGVEADELQGDADAAGGHRPPRPRRTRPGPAAGPAGSRRRARRRLPGAAAWRPPYMDRPITPSRARVIVASAVRTFFPLSTGIGPHSGYYGTDPVDDVVVNCKIYKIRNFNSLYLLSTLDPLRPPLRLVGAGGSALFPPLRPPLRAPLVACPGSTTGLDSGHAEPQVVVPVARRAPAPVRRPTVARVVVPAPASEHTDRSLRGTERVVRR